MTDKPIGIVTLPGNANYGNRLQNYALQEAIKSLGFPIVESLEGFPRHETKPLKARRLVATAYGRRKELFARAVGRPGARPEPDVYVCPPLRREAVRAFSERYITSAEQDYNSTHPGAFPVDHYHRLVVGSDQVWNPAFTHANPEWFLSFAHPEQRVAYAASIGIPEIPKYLRSRYRNGLKQIRSLSVREHRAARTVLELSGRRPPVVLDPAMLLTREQWDEIAVEPPHLQLGSYVATFMLSAGDSVPAGVTDLTAVRDFALRESLKLVDLHSPTDPERIAFGPSEFIGAIRGSGLLVTDSFHATVFATLFHVPFLLVPRGVMNSRFETLLAHTGLSNRMLSQVPEVKEALDIDWADVGKRIVDLRVRSLDFLSESLN